MLDTHGILVKLLAAIMCTPTQDQKAFKADQMIHHAQRHLPLGAAHEEHHKNFVQNISQHWHIDLSNTINRHHTC